MVMDHCWNQALDAIDLYPPTPTKLKKSRKLSTRMTLGFGERLEYSMVNCRSREEQMKLETIKTPAMDPGYEDVLQTSHSTVGHLSTKLRPVRCPKCRQVLPELANVPVYRCGGCNTVLQAKTHKNDQDKCSLKHNNGGDPNEYAQSNGMYIRGVNLLDEVASPTEPNHHKNAESEVDKSGNCLEEENGDVNFSDEVASSTELNHLGSEESSPVAGAHSEVDENKNCLEQEVVSSTELKNNEIEVSSPVVRAYSEANKHGICNGKQTGGVNISDEVVSSTELNDNEIKVSSPVVTAHSEANKHIKCMEQNNGRNQSEFGDFKLDCSKNTKSSGEISSSTELACQEIEESSPVIETNAQLDENSKSPMSLDQSQKRKLTGFDHVSSVDSLENIAIADCSSEFSVTHRDMPNFPTTSKFSNYVYEGSVSSYDGNDDQVPDPYLHRLMELEQPAMFTELGMDLDDNKGIIDNLLRFLKLVEIGC
ncbi:hypothetical protein RHSIM_Rhsim05G0036500 [Rhododendron simsii]|uniref:Enhanced disease resistance 4-like N-terminal domain-containing protein n=1 Tax=Rhododendron simsii TaxID=118357 RepID=A0A834LQK8_RHOSS|nr:hypothetical protein RHSIM_Rhsim05G0036500 [Rhododendron simsii]